MDDVSRQQEIINLLETKAALKLKVFNNATEVFETLKDVLHEMSGDINDQLSNPRLTKVEYRDRGKFEAQIHIATDLLIFSMHSNVFEFNRDHPIHETEYIRKDSKNSYCGVVNIYNFLADSFKFNRTTDEGYLIGRIFINHENHFFVEGKRQQSYGFNSFTNNVIDRANILDIIENAIQYSINFDLLVPSYDSVKIVAVEQMNTKQENSKIQTGKRLGYEFTPDDI